MQRQPLSWHRFCHADSLLGFVFGELMTAPFERWGPESSFEIMDSLSGNWIRQLTRRAFILPIFFGMGVALAAGVLRDGEVSLFPHRRTPPLHRVLISRVLRKIDDKVGASADNLGG